MACLQEVFFLFYCLIIDVCCIGGQTACIYCDAFSADKEILKQN